MSRYILLDVLLRFEALWFTVDTCRLYKGNAHSDILSFVICVCLVEFRPCLVWLLALLSISAGCVVRGIRVSVGSNNVIRSPILFGCEFGYECFVVFCFVYWTEFSSSVSTRLFLSWPTRARQMVYSLRHTVFGASMRCAITWARLVAHHSLDY